MSTTTTTPYMSLILPIPTVEIGPAWAVELNSAFSLVDQHNHTTGNGVQIPTAGLNINADLTFSGFNATNLRAVKMQSQSSALSGSTDVGCLYVSGGDLYYNSSTGQQVHITSGSALNLSSAGSISGLSGTNAALTYANSNQTFTFTQNSGITASIASGPVTISQNSSGANGITVQSPNSLAASYSLTLPSATPSTQSLVAIDSSGNMTAATSNASLALPIGTVLDFAGSTAPANFVLCDGSSYSTTGMYAGLYAVIGYTFGGSSGMFNVPDARGRVTIGVGTGSGLTTRNLGDTPGEENHTLSVNEMPSHSHSVLGGQTNIGVLTNGAPFIGANTTFGVVSGQVYNTGGGAGHNNIQPSIAFNKIIKYQ